MGGHGLFRGSEALHCQRVNLQLPIMVSNLFFMVIWNFSFKILLLLPTSCVVEQ